jgi:hypothetical protein
MRKINRADAGRNWCSGHRLPLYMPISALFQEIMALIRPEINANVAVIEPLMKTGVGARPHVFNFIKQMMGTSRPHPGS